MGGDALSRFMRLCLAVLLALLCSGPAQAQYMWVLDPADGATYKEWAKNEMRQVKKYTLHVAGKSAGHATWNAGVIPTVQFTGVPTDAADSFWSFHVPEWVKRWGNNPFSGAKAGGGNQSSIGDLMQGITKYQNVRASLRTMALIKASIAGMRFEVNAWKMMKNLDVVQYENFQVYENPVLVGNGSWGVDPGPPTTVTRPMGVVSFGIVPRGKEGWRAAVEYLEDDPHYDGDGRQRVKYRGPRSFGDMTLEATEPLTDNLNDEKTGIEEFLEMVDRGTRAVGQGIADIRTMVNRRVGEAIRDADSPHKLWEKTKQLQHRRDVAYNSMIGLRAMIEARPAAEIRAEYAALLENWEVDARRAYATAEASANFYQQLANSADNVIAPLENPKRLAEIKKLEDLYAKWVGEMNDRNLKAELNEFLEYVGSAFPSLVPYVGAIKLPIDFIAITTGDAAAAMGDDDDEDSDIKAEMCDTQARIFAIRFGYYLWEELRAWRKLTYLMEQQQAAAKGIQGDTADSEALESAFDMAISRRMAAYQARIAMDGIQRWVDGN